MRRVGVAVVLFVLAIAATADEGKRATFLCRGISATDFCCMAKNVDGLKPVWRLYDPTLDHDTTEGQSACFPAPREWRTLEMKVDDGTRVHIVRARVTRDFENKRVVFAPAGDE